METIDLYDALNEMLMLSKENKPFSFSFASFEKKNKTSDGIKFVKNAILRRTSTIKDNERRDIMLNYKEVDTDNYRMFYSILLLTFNNKKVILK